MLRLLFVVSLLVSSTSGAQPTEKFNFKKAQLRLGDKVLNVEIADNPRLLQQGLMYRTELDKNAGMLFIFIGEQKRSFWMKNTFIDLSIGFFDKNKKLVDILDMNAVKSEMDLKPPRYQSRKPAQYALEVNKGWFKRNKIKLGMTFKLIQQQKH